ncbi:Imm72 family immunity protein [Acinetobacter sp. YH12239]|uniref:Imm72 family immunity protein n=1 Tax=Acinetobacter sp. YH12239 TaxID=2601166 RepID=UPI0015D40B8A|nr:Imm72 family immunity protein [Acinetobacter sp. YH12239]
MYTIDRKERDQTFYLIKKYSSYQYLYHIYKLKKEFVDAFEQQLRQPPPSVQDQTIGVHEYHEKEFLYYLYVINNSEKGLDLLLKTESKKDAYDLIFEGSIYGNIFGRYGDEHGLVDDVFYQNLGLGRYYGDLDGNHDHTKYILKLLLASAMTFCVSNTLYAGEYVIHKEDRIYDKWSYESLFSKPNWPPCKQIVEPISPCPDYNENATDQIHTGEEIQISGIYEPWFEKPVYQKLTNDPEYNVYVGCPNYFLEGSEATQYKLEGTDDWYDVKWRLIWEDNRYIDGTIPEEEKNYIFDIENIGKQSNQPETESTEKLSMAAGQVSPKAGYWYTTAKLNSRQYFKKGDIFPDFESDWGEVYWQFDGEE